MVLPPPSPDRPTREHYDRVNARPAQQVAELLGLQKAREHHKFSCPVHGGSDSLHAYPGEGRGFFCFVCDKAFSNVDIAMEVWGLDHGAACQQLADRLGIFVASRQNAPPSRRNAPRRPPQAPRAQVRLPEAQPLATAVTYPRLDALRVEGMVPQEPAEVYRAVVDALTLTDRGASYLRGRGLGPDLAGGQGVRSIDGAEGWAELRAMLAGSFCLDEQEAANCHEKNTPWSGYAPCLVIPYVWHGEVAAIKLRHLAPRDKNERYRTLSPEGVDRNTLPPFNADVLTRCAGQVLHIVEGELNALAIAQAGGVAVGLPAANWPRAWTTHLEGVKRLALWFDDDKGSNKKALSFGGALQSQFGGFWLRNHTVRVPLPNADDANDLLLRGVLREYIDRAAVV